jgi:hypothetical protein
MMERCRTRFPLVVAGIGRHQMSSRRRAASSRVCPEGRERKQQLLDNKCPDYNCHRAFPRESDVELDDAMYLTNYDSQPLQVIQTAVH